jgi:YfiR/HmsC-like
VLVAGQRRAGVARVRGEGQLPLQAFASAGAPITICILGDDPFGPMLDDVVKGQHVEGHPYVVRRIRAAARGMGCQILFVAHPAGQSAAEALRAVAGEPVLTVTDGAAASAGGMIQFLLQDGRVRFNADEAAAEASGVPISSKLLDLAASVRRPAK